MKTPDGVEIVERWALCYTTLQAQSRTLDASEMQVCRLIEELSQAEAENARLLEALKECMYEIRDRSTIKKAALEVIREIEATR